MCVCVCVCVCARVCDYILCLFVIVVVVVFVVSSMLSCSDVLARFKERIGTLSKELASCAKRPGEALLKAAKIFLDSVERHVQG